MFKCAVKCFWIHIWFIINWTLTPTISADLEKEQQDHSGTKDELAAVNAEIDDI